MLLLKLEKSFCDMCDPAVYTVSNEFKFDVSFLSAIFILSHFSFKYNYFANNTGFLKLNVRAFSSVCYQETKKWIRISKLHATSTCYIRSRLFDWLSVLCNTWL